MDMIKIGKFLAALRTEQNLTQAQLGERLGVTNKTVSRWETGTYLPPAEQLLAMSALYGVSINELLTGERLSPASYQSHAEENLKAVLAESAFSVQEKTAYFRKKWDRDHAFEQVTAAVLTVALFALGMIRMKDLACIPLILGFAYSVAVNNRRAAYVESHVYTVQPPTDCAK